MLALMTLRLFKHRAVHIQNAVDKIGLVLHAAVSDNAQHNCQLHRRRQVEALADRCVEGVAESPVLVPDFTFNLLGGHKALAFAVQVDACLFAKAVDAGIFSNIVNADTVA